MCFDELQLHGRYVFYSHVGHYSAWGQRSSCCIRLLIHLRKSHEARKKHNEADDYTSPCVMIRLALIIAVWVAHVLTEESAYDQNDTKDAGAPSPYLGIIDHAASAGHFKEGKAFALRPLRDITLESLTT